MVGPLADHLVGACDYRQQHLTCALANADAGVRPVCVDPRPWGGCSSVLHECEATGPPLVPNAGAARCFESSRNRITEPLAGLAKAKRIVGFAVETRRHQWCRSIRLDLPRERQGRRLVLCPVLPHEPPCFHCRVIGPLKPRSASRRWFTILRHAQVPSKDVVCAIAEVNTNAPRSAIAVNIRMRSPRLCSKRL